MNPLVLLAIQRMLANRKQGQTPSQGLLPVQDPRALSVSPADAAKNASDNTSLVGYMDANMDSLKALQDQVRLNKMRQFFGP